MSDITYQKAHNLSIWNRGIRWLTNLAFKNLPYLICSYQVKSSKPQYLYYEDYVKSPELARQAGLMCIRQMRKDYTKVKQEMQKSARQFKSNPQIVKQKPHELLCPICLQIYNGPVTTSCGHTFCHKCLDQAILFNASCPVCRTKIRGEEFVVSLSLEKIIIMTLRKIEFQEVDKYVKKQEQYKEWVRQRSLRKGQIEIGQCIDVRDTQFIWCRASILQIFHSECLTKDERVSILVHYEGWSYLYDQVISLDSQRLARYKFYSSRLQIPHYNLNQENNQHIRSIISNDPVIQIPNIIDMHYFNQQEEWISNDSQQSSQTEIHPFPTRIYQRSIVIDYAHEYDLRQNYNPELTTMSQQTQAWDNQSIIANHCSYLTHNSYTQQRQNQQQEQSILQGRILQDYSYNIRLKQSQDLLCHFNRARQSQINSRQLISSLERSEFAHELQEQGQIADTFQRQTPRQTQRVMSEINYGSAQQFQDKQDLVSLLHIVCQDQKSDRQQDQMSIMFQSEQVQSVAYNFERFLELRQSSLRDRQSPQIHQKILIFLQDTHRFHEQTQRLKIDKQLQIISIRGQMDQMENQASGQAASLNRLYQAIGQQQLSLIQQQPRNCCIVQDHLAQS